MDDAGVVDQHVQARARGDGGGPAVRVGDVEVAEGDIEPVGAQALGGLLARVVEDVAGEDRRAFAREPLGMGSALTARAAGDQGDAPREPAAHRVTCAGRAARSSVLWASRSCRFQMARTMSMRESGTSTSAKCAASADRRAGSRRSMRTISSAWAE